MKLHVLLILVLTFCAQCTGGSPPSKTDAANQNSAKEAPTSPNATVAQEQNNQNFSAGAESEAQRVYIDPETGEFTSPPAKTVPTARTTAPSAAFSTSDEGLEEKPSPVPGGGTMVELKGRFRTPLTATIDSNGKIKIEHQASEEQE